ncbi:hypothetical protein MASR1M8_10120 [Thermomonas brevis]
MRTQYLQAPVESFRGKGFTLVELMVTVAVLAIVATLAVPSFNNLIRGNRLVSSANEMVTLLQTARAAAIGHRARVLVCPSDDGSTCAATAGRRWIATMTQNATTTVLRDVTVSPAVTVSSSANLSAAGHRFTFAPSGFSSAGANASGSIGLCIPEMPGQNGIAVSAGVGRVSSARRSAGGNCSVPGDN